MTVEETNHMYQADITPQGAWRTSANRVLSIPRNSQTGSDKVAPATRVRGASDILTSAKPHTY